MTTWTARAVPVRPAWADDQDQSARQQQEQEDPEAAAEQAQSGGWLAATPVFADASVVADHPICDAAELQEDRTNQEHPNGDVQGNYALHPEHDGRDFEQDQPEDEAR